MTILIVINHIQTLLFYNHDKINKRIYKEKRGQKTSNLANNSKQSSNPCENKYNYIINAYVSFYKDVYFLKYAP